MTARRSLVHGDVIASSTANDAENGGPKQSRGSKGITWSRTGIGDVLDVGQLGFEVRDAAPVVEQGRYDGQDQDDRYDETGDQSTVRIGRHLAQSIARHRREDGHVALVACVIHHQGNVTTGRSQLPITKPQLSLSLSLSLSLG